VQSEAKQTGPWSLDWLRQILIKTAGKDVLIIGSKGDDIFTFAACEEPSRHLLTPEKKSDNIFKHWTGFVKRVARMPLADRREILKILKKKERKRKVCTNKSKETSTSNSESSKNSTPSVNNDWANWVVLHEKSNAVKEDVNEMGKVLGVKFKGDPNNSLNLLTRGRKEWRSVSGVGGSTIVEERG